MKHLFKRMLTIASLCASVLQTQAQDTYWSMTGNRVYNVKTNTLTTISATGIPLDYSNPNPRAVFSAAGSVLFSSSMSSIDFANAWNNITGEGARVIIPLTAASKCNQYAIINTRGVTVPHGSALDITIMDVSAVTNDINTTNFPNVVSSANISVGDALYYDAVAAPAQANGDHYYYFISANNGPGQPGPFIEQYTIHNDGTRPTTTNSYGTTANYRQYDSYTTHYINSKAKISNDGAYIAYQDINGNMITFNTATQAYAVGPNLSTIYGLEGVNIGGTVRWYFSTATQLGYFNQGSTSTTTLSTVAGIKSDIAAGANGLMFIARGTTTGGNAADLMSFDPNAAFSASTKQTSCVYNNGTSYSFGNQLSGENTSEFSTIKTDFTVNSARGTIANPKVVYTCGSMVMADLTSPTQTYLSVGISQVDAAGNNIAGGFNWGYSFPRPFGGTINLKSLPVDGNTWLGTVGHEGYYKISMFNSDACGRASNVTEYIKVETPATPVVGTFTVNSQSPTLAVPYPPLNLCNGATALNLAATLTGTYSSYDVTVTKLSGTPPSFTYGAGATYTVTSGSFSGFDIAANATLGPIVAAYNGYVSVKITAHGTCVDNAKEEIFQIARGTTLASLDFTLNGLSQTGSTPRDVWQCNNNIPLVVNPTVTGTVGNYTITVNIGTYTGGVFTQTSTQTIANIAPSSMPYDLAPNFTGMSGYIGYVQVVMTANGPCGTPVTTTHLYNIRSASAIVDFVMIGPSDDNGTAVCNYLGTGFSGLQSRHTSTTFTAIGQVSTPPCEEGWLGSSTLGISKGTATNSASAPTGYEIRVDEYDATGTTLIKNVMLKTPLSISNANFTFDNKTTPLHYFSNNYDVIKNNNVYKATVSMTTVECGTVSQYSYFKIIDGGASSGMGGSGYPETWKTVQVAPTDIVSVYPNPAASQVHFAWTSKAEGQDASIAIVDVLGRVIYNQTAAEAKGSNDRMVDLSNVAAGTYHYTLKTSNGETSGTVVKQ